MLQKEEIKELISALSHQDRQVRIKAVEELGKDGSSEIVEPLIKAMEDKDFGVRAYAAEALGMSGDSRALDTLIKALKDALLFCPEKRSNCTWKYGG